MIYLGALCYLLATTGANLLALDYLMNNFKDFKSGWKDKIARKKYSELVYGITGYALEDCKRTVIYYYNGKRYDGVIDSASYCRSYTRGEAVELYVNKENPKDIMYKYCNIDIENEFLYSLLLLIGTSGCNILLIMISIM